MNADTFELCGLLDWLGFQPKNLKRRRLKKWMRQLRRQVRPCDHDWRLILRGEDAGWSRCPKCRAWLVPTPEI